jgi:hypothetical protein
MFGGCLAVVWFFFYLLVSAILFFLCLYARGNGALPFSVLSISYMLLLMQRLEWEFPFLKKLILMVLKAGYSKMGWIYLLLWVRNQFVSWKSLLKLLKVVGVFYSMCMIIVERTPLLFKWSLIRTTILVEFWTKFIIIIEVLHAPKVFQFTT